MLISAPATRGTLTAKELAEGELHYTSLILANPHDADTHYRFGMMKHYAGFSAEAIPLIERAIALDPRREVYYNDLGIVFASLGNLSAAIERFGEACSKNPGYAESFRNLGEAYLRSGQPVAAISPLQRAVMIRPTFAAALNSLGCAFLQVDKASEALESFRRSLQHDPKNIDANLNLINTLSLLQRYEDVVAHSVPLLREYENAQIALNLAKALTALGRTTDALFIYEKLYELFPDQQLVLAGLQRVYSLLRRYGEAVEIGRQALNKNPGIMADAIQVQLAQDLHFAGEREESRILIQRLLTQPLPASTKKALNFFTSFGLLSDTEISPSDAFKALSAAGAQLEQTVPKHQPHGNLPLVDRRLRIGYVSGDFKNHPVARFFLPLLTKHNKSQFEIFGYYSDDIKDAVTAEIRSACDHWRDCVGTSVSAYELASQIRSDAIDILVDLAGISAKNRLDAFVLKPAPVQMTWMGTAWSTGLTTIDYRITDHFADPIGMTEKFHTEELLRLPGHAASLILTDEYPDISPLPSLKSKIVTFASLNATYKINQTTIETWARILSIATDSRLLVCGIDSQESENKIRSLFAQFLPDLSRLAFKRRCPLDEFLKLFSQIDISLDPFPYNGGTTTMHSLLMGVPVITLAGDATISRSGVALLNTAMLPQLVAETVEEYVDCAVELAQDRTRLSELRNSLRTRIASNPHNDPAFITQSLETAYRQCWKRWCAEHPAR